MKTLQCNPFVLLISTIKKEKKKVYSSEQMEKIYAVMVTKVGYDR
jgi:hypothetical protein